MYVVPKLDDEQAVLEGGSATQWCAESTRLGPISEPEQSASPCEVLMRMPTTAVSVLSTVPPWMGSAARMTCSGLGPSLQPKRAVPSNTVVSTVWWKERMVGLDVLRERLEEGQSPS